MSTAQQKTVKKTFWKGRFPCNALVDGKHIVLKKGEELDKDVLAAMEKSEQGKGFLKANAENLNVVDVPV